MLKSATFLAGSVFAAMVTLQPVPAHADATIQFHFGVPSPGVGVYHDDYDRRLSCRQARRILRRDYGYRHIEVIDCQGDSYKFYVTKRGRDYKVRLDAYSGRVTRRTRI